MRTILIGLFGLSLMVVVAAFVIFQLENSGWKLEREIDDYWEVGAFDLTDQNGQPYSSEALKGKVWLANFVFTSCKAECPALTVQMNQVRQRLGSLPDVAYISFSVDPQTDTPERLKEFSQIYGPDPSWTLLTGDAEMMTELIRSQFLQPLTREEGEDDPEEVSIFHSNMILVIDGEGFVRYYGDGRASQAVNSFARVVKKLLKESGLSRS